MNESIVAKIDELKDGEMKKVSAGKKKVLLLKVDGKFHAIAGWCTHQRAPLEDGFLNGERLLCHWHQACFNCKTGDLEEPPSLDALPSFEVRTDGENVIVKIPDDLPYQRVPEMVLHNIHSDSRTFVILGGGASGNFAAQTLRQDGFEGRIVMITREKSLPYDRTELSKRYLKQNKPDPSRLLLRNENFYKDNNIEIISGKKVVEALVSSKSLILDDGSEIRYDKLLLATGADAFKPNTPGIDLPNIFTLRTIEDAKKIHEASKKDLRAVIIGAGFIGMETAAALKARGLSVTIVAPSAVPFEKNLGEKIGKMVLDLFKENGISFKLKESLSGFEGNGKVEKVVLTSGEKIDADLVIIGIGARLSTQYIKEVGLNKDGSINVDQYLQVNEQTFAAGDIASFPDFRNGEKIRIEHWRLAEQHGKIAAHNMMGKKIPFNLTPFFWTDLFGLRIQYVGYVGPFEEIIFQGEPSTRKFIAYYVKRNKIFAVCGCGYDLEMSIIAELMRQNKMPDPDKCKNGSAINYQL